LDFANEAVLDQEEKTKQTEEILVNRAATDKK